MDKLPNELLLHLCSYFHGGDIIIMRLVCKRFKSFVYAEYERLPRVAFPNSLFRVSPSRFNLHFNFGRRVEVSRSEIVSRRGGAWTEARPIESSRVEMTYDEFAETARHVAIPRFGVLEVKAQRLDARLVEVFSLLGYTEHFEHFVLVLDVQSIQLDRKTFRSFLNRTPATELHLCGNFDRSFITNGMFAGTRLLSFFLGATKSGGIPMIDLPFLVPFLKNWIKYQELTGHNMYAEGEGTFGPVCICKQLHVDVPVGDFGHICNGIAVPRLFVEDIPKLEELVKAFFVSMDRLSADAVSIALFITIHSMPEALNYRLKEWCVNLERDPNVNKRWRGLQMGRFVLDVEFEHVSKKRLIRFSFLPHPCVTAKEKPTYVSADLPKKDTHTQPDPSYEVTKEDAGDQVEQITSFSAGIEITDFDDLPTLEKYLRDNRHSLTGAEWKIHLAKQDMLIKEKETVYREYMEEQERKFRNQGAAGNKGSRRKRVHKELVRRDASAGLTENADTTTNKRARGGRLPR